MTDDVLLWDLAETARRLGGISPRTVRRMLERGDLRKKTIGRRVLVIAESVTEYLAPKPPAAHNQIAGPAVREETVWQKPKNVIPMASTGAAIRRSGGSATSTPAAVELGARLGLGSTAGPKPKKKPKRS